MASDRGNGWLAGRSVRLVARVAGQLGGRFCSSCFTELLAGLMG